MAKQWQRRNARQMQNPNYGMYVDAATDPINDEVDMSQVQSQLNYDDDNNFDAQMTRQMLGNEKFRRGLIGEGVSGRLIGKAMKGEIDPQEFLRKYGAKGDSPIHNNKNYSFYGPNSDAEHTFQGLQKAFYRTQDFDDVGSNKVNDDDTGAKKAKDLINPDVQYSNEYAQSRAYSDALSDFRMSGGMTDLKFGRGEEQEATELTFRKNFADNLKQYLKPNPVSQLGAGLGLPAGMLSNGYDDE